MADPNDIYSDLASFVVSDTGMTLVLLRSLPVAAGTPPEQVPLGDYQLRSPDGTQQIGFDTVARIRMTPNFAVSVHRVMHETLETLGLLGGDHQGVPVPEAEGVPPGG